MTEYFIIIFFLLVNCFLKVIYYTEDIVQYKHMVFKIFLDLTQILLLSLIGWTWYRCRSALITTD